MSKKILMTIFSSKKQDHAIIRTYQNAHIILINGEKLLVRHFSIEKIFRLHSKSVRNLFFETDSKI